MALMEEGGGYGTRRHWDRVFGTLAETAPGLAGRTLNRSVLDLARELLGRRPGARVLDLASGSGALARDLAGTGYEAVAADLSEVALARAKRAGIGVAAMDAGRLALASGAFDLVACLRAVWTFPDRAAALAEAARVLRPGGWLVVQVWDAPPDCRLLGLGAGLLGKLIPGLVRPEGTTGPFDLGPAEAAQALAGAGCGDIAVRRHAVEVAVDDAGTFWREFGSIAETAHAALLSQPEAQRRRADRAFDALAAKLRPPGGGGLALPLAWHLCAGRVRPGKAPQ